MPITLTLNEVEELWEEAAQNTVQPAFIEPFEVYEEMPSYLGRTLLLFFHYFFSNP
jgi:hypothetical protein